VRAGLLSFWGWCWGAVGQRMGQRQSPSREPGGARAHQS